MIDRDESQTHLLRFHRSRLPVALNSKLILACYQLVEAIKESSQTQFNIAYENLYKLP